MTPSTSLAIAEGLTDVMAAANPGWTHTADEGVVTSTPTIRPGDEVRVLPDGRFVSRRKLAMRMATGEVEWRRPAEVGA